MKQILLPGFSVTAHWAFIWFLDGNENKVVISIVGMNGKNFLQINAHGVLRRMGAVMEIPGTQKLFLLPAFIFGSKCLLSLKKVNF